jgi:O-antigen/teichoic acid export membrane protein
MIDSVSRTRSHAAVVRRRLAEHVRLPLHRDAYALALNSAFTAGTGLIYWIVAANAFTAHAVGLNSALISAMTLLSGIASLNLPNIVVRFLPESGDRALSRVVCAYAAAAGLAACAAVVFILGVTSWTPPLRFLRSDQSLQAWFVFSTVAWCLFTIQDSVLTALGRAIWVPVENAVFSVLKIALLIAAATALPRYGIFVSWTIAMLVSVAGVNLLIFTRLMRQAGLRRCDAIEVRNRAFVRYFAADYACSVAWLSNLYLLPLIVTAVAGATTNAYWSLAFTVALPLYAISQNVGTSLMLHGTIDRQALPTLARKAAIQGARVLIPAVVLLVLCAPLLLSLFGPSYAHRSTTVLRVLAIGVLPNLLITLSVDIARVQRRLRRAVIALGAEAVIAVGLAPPLLEAMGVTGVAIGWTGAQLVVAAGLLVTWRGSFVLSAPDQVSPVTSGETAFSPIAPSAVAEAATNGALSDPGDPHPVLGALFADLERHGLRWALLRVPSRISAPTGDVDILVAPEDSAALRGCAGALGFMALPGWDAAPDLVLVRYDRASDRWLVLDVSTAITFRRPRSWTLEGATERVLRDRSLRRGIALPADPDQFWLLLLHCLLDKGHVAPHHLGRLRRLASVAAHSPLGTQVCSAAGAAFSESQFVKAARSGDADELKRLGVDLAVALKRNRTVAQRLGALRRDAIRTVRKPLLLHRRRGPSLALLGPNGVGKSTAAAELQRSVPFDVRIVYMGLWKTPTRLRARPWKLVEIAIRPVRIWWRYLRAQYHQARGRVVVFDRYVYDALLPPAAPLLTAKRVYFFLLAHVIPGPRAAVFLDVPGRVAYGRKPEATADELESERLLYAELTRRSFPVQLIDAGADADTVRAEITTILWQELTLRWRGALAPV